MKLTDKVKLFQEEIVIYYTKHGRHNLPWRLTRDPWQILLAEVMLRKTTSDQAAKIFYTVSAFSPEAVDGMDVSELEKLLKPLGMYQVRANQLKTIAKACLQAESAALESDVFLRSLPGIGRYISNSVRCCAFGHPAPALDTNMIRIIQRVFGWKSKRKRPREDKKLWDFAESLVPHNNCREYNWGVLDLGSSICTHQKPKCLQCPLTTICDYYHAQIHSSVHPDKIGKHNG